MVEHPAQETLALVLEVAPVQMIRVPPLIHWIPIRAITTMGSVTAVTQKLATVREITVRNCY